MKFEPTDIAGLTVIHYQPFADARGGFVKTIHRESFEQEGLEWQFAESYFSISARDVIRGMHFQVPPHDHDKLVHVVKGSIIDVVLDIRNDAPTYGSWVATLLNDENRKALYIGKGLAHGFLSLEPDTIVEYHTTTQQHKACEGGVLWNSFGYEWPVAAPVLSERDKGFAAFSHAQTWFA
ncbi:dTDP-4-dehydrorhamnose 3,5-epimerase/CDP-3, 6-dideoxy-D-glycero-D-glycero-4-hexulose-5-epimerase [Filimonas zeae]|uniref:dTDP-4-dehydrorhamnose 3,5-epimerase n=1 Tax=Filimonas zeae TaxID=1737353 RepID=A0A917IV88_9BACT|nr:dTDP-4-dehydrorhamnose 3,5-epimerase [Filimonas zeae]MDR6339008.1 dTDP-4-dehydrorhamnose 3,5-epimerase/CDP-3, 6-dideoxy-D-glycero-D-glycero-4-hexulose-5-epimerase [Filimonas zeae]GGH65545.1 dTDP-4-dehydrorhamnose 3,5-epimerase [Filimonas zeae]